MKVGWTGGKREADEGYYYLRGMDFGQLDIVVKRPISLEATPFKFAKSTQAIICLKICSDYDDSTGLTRKSVGR